MHVSGKPISGVIFRLKRFKALAMTVILTFFLLGAGFCLDVPDLGDPASPEQKTTVQHIESTEQKELAEKALEISRLSKLCADNTDLMPTFYALLVVWSYFGRKGGAGRWQIVRDVCQFVELATGQNLNVNEQGYFEIFGIQFNEGDTQNFPIPTMNKLRAVLNKAGLEFYTTDEETKAGTLKWEWQEPRKRVET